uniref:PLAT domain-containing protein n=1 Tax=Ciona savignyi TaxID=51511 RepID=H2ZMP7_CIOSA
MASNTKPRHVWDLNGHRVPCYEYEDTIEDSNSSMTTYSSTSDDIDKYTCRPPSSRTRRRDMRPSSRQGHPEVFLLNNPHLAGSYRPHSPGYPNNQHLNIDSTPRPTLTPDSGVCTNTGTQTSNHARSSDFRHSRIVHKIPYSEDSSSTDERTVVELCKYVVKVKTGDRLGAGTTADIYLSLH